MRTKWFFKFFVVFFSILPFLLFQTAASAYYIDFTANNSVSPDRNITIVGSLGNTTVEAISGVTIYANLSNGQRATSITTATGSFNFSLNTTGIAGNSILNITDGTIIKRVQFRVTNVSSASVSITNVPPFSPGVFLTLNITPKNSSGVAIANQTITANVFATDGAQPSWGTNTSTTNTNGIALLNFSIPSNATLGRYMVDVENGAGTVFFALTRYTVSVVTKDNSGENRITFAPNSHVTIETTIKSNNAPVASAPVVVTVFNPNNIPTVSSVLTTSSTGVVSYNYTASSGGTYKIKVNASGEEVFTSFSVKTYSVKLEKEEEGGFFFKFGGQQFFTPGQNVTLKIVAADVSKGTLLQRGSNFSCNSSYIKLESVWNVNGSSVNSSLQGAYIVESTYQMTPTCAISFNLPAAHIGLFGVKINLTAGTSLADALSASAEAGQGYFSIQRYGLRIEPASPFGGKEMHALLLPNDNASFNLYAFNISSGQDLAGGNITAATITSIRSLRGGTQNTTFTQFFAAASGEDPPYINAVTPSATGPQSVAVTASVSGEVLTASTMYIGKYLMGYAQSSGARFGEGGGGEGRGGSGQYISCSGTVEFYANVFDSKTMMPASSVTFISLVEARDDMTGQDISSCLNITRATTGSTGRATINVTFSSACSLSGFYFMMFNVSYKNYYDEIPGGFECKNMNFRPQTYINGQEGFNAKGTAAVTFVVSNVSYTNNASRIVQSGTARLSRIMNFNPAIGPTLLTLATAITGNISWLSNAYSGNFTVYPQNFSLTTWPSGFFDVAVQVTDSSSGTSDSAQGGFGSVAFETISNWWGSCMGPPEECQAQNTDALGNQKFSPGQIVTMQVYANLPAGTEQQYTNATFQAQHVNVSTVFLTLTSPESGAQYNVINITKTLVNGSMTPFTAFGDEQYTWENYTLTFSLPANIKDGSYMGDIKITTNANTSLTADEMIFMQVKGLTIGVPLITQLSTDYSWGGNLTWMERDVFNVTTDPQDQNGGSLMIQNSTWSFANWTWIKNYLRINSTTAAGNPAVCVKAQLVLTYSGQLTGNTTYPGYSVLVFENTTTKQLFLGNRSGGGNYSYTNISNIIPLNATNPIPGTKEYLWEVVGCGYTVFVNVTTLATSDRGAGTVSTDFPWGEYHIVNKNFYLPLVAFTGSNTTAVRKHGYNFTITDVAVMNTEGFGIKSKLPQTSNGYALWSYSPAVTNSDGLAFIRMNATNNTKMMAFWSVNSTPKTGASFMTAIKFGTKAFNAYGQYVKLLPERSKNITLSYTATNCPYYVRQDLNSTPVATTPCYSGVFVETAGDRFAPGLAPTTYYFVLINDTLEGGSTNTFKYLYIDDDSTINATCASNLPNPTTTNESNQGAGGNNNCVGQGYAPKKITITASQRTADFGQPIEVAFADVFFDGTTSAVLTAFQQRPSISWSTVSSATERKGMQICSRDFAGTRRNASVVLEFMNWMYGIMGAPDFNITMFNLTNGAAIDRPAAMSTSVYDGCFITEVLPKGNVTIGATSYLNQWVPGRNEVKGTATDLNGLGEEELWVGPVEYWTGGANL